MSTQTPPPAENVDTLALRPIPNAKPQTFAWPAISLSTLLQAATAFAFVLSCIYMLLFFRTLRINPLSVPLTLSDYAMTFTGWAIPLLYALSVLSMAALEVNLKQKATEKIKVLITLVMAFVVFGTITQALFALTDSSTALYTLLAGIAYYFFVTRFIKNDLYTHTKLALVAIFVLTTILLILTCGYSIGNSLKKPQHPAQDFRHDAVTIRGYLLRSLEKGLLVYELHEKNPRIAFLPHAEKDNILYFAAPFAIAPQPSHPDAPTAPKNP